ncbi:MAG: WD40 repeat domain-containing protein [Promethearchaeota archaeon]
MVISPDGNLLASAHNKIIKIWNMNDGNILQTLTGHRNRVLSIAFSHSNQFFVSSSLDRSIKIWKKKQL